MLKIEYKEMIMNLAQKTYLALIAAEAYPEQAPEHKYAKNRDLWWFLLPVIGFLMFYVAVNERAEKS